MTNFDTDDERPKPSLDDLPYATRTELGAVKGRITKIEKALPPILDDDAPDPVEAFNEVAGALEARIKEHEDGFAEFSTHLAKQTAMILGEIESLRTALAALAVAASETRRTADRTAELMGVKAE